MKTERQKQIDIWLQTLSDGLAKLVLQFLTKVKIISELEKTRRFNLTVQQFRGLTGRDFASELFVSEILETLNEKGIMYEKIYAWSEEEKARLKGQKSEDLIVPLHDISLGEEFDYALFSLKRRFGISEDFYSYDYDTKTFSIKQKNNKWASINFRTKRGKRYQSTLFEILLENWEKEGATITRKEIIERASALLGEHFNDVWLKNTLRHLKETIDSNKQIGVWILLEKDDSNLVFGIKNPNS